MKPFCRLILAAAVIVGLGGCHKQQQTAEQPASGQTTETKTCQKVRGPAVAGLFYPKHETDLAEQIDELLDEVQPEPIENLRGLVCPHAGYDFSGKTAAFGYKLLKGRDIRTAIVLGSSHRAAFNGASIPEVEAYQTPLGMVRLSPKAAEIAKLEPFVVNPKCRVQRPSWWRVAPKELPPFGQDTPHSWEHSVEVHLPFLQRTLNGFALVPIVFGQDADPQAAAGSLEKYLDGRTILVASSDLSHYLPDATAKRMDRTCIEAICTLKTASLKRQEACGKGPILTLMHLALRKGWKTKLLDYRTSGDVTGDLSRGVVGYAAIAFYDPGTGAKGGSKVEKTADPPQQSQFTPQQRKLLLRLARDTVERVVNNRTSAELDAQTLPEKLTEEKGCFVTLKKDGQLRGCIGSIFPQEPLYLAVIHMARRAAVADRRFPPVSPAELDRIEVEVSVLTVPELLEFSTPGELLRKLRPHRDGVVLRMKSAVGPREATFLPQVWDELPDKEEFLGRLCQKAGLGPNAWKGPSATVLLYQVEAFKESEM